MNSASQLSKLLSQDGAASIRSRNLRAKYIQFRSCRNNDAMALSCTLLTSSPSCRSIGRDVLRRRRHPSPVAHSHGQDDQHDADCREWRKNQDPKDHAPCGGPCFVIELALCCCLLPKDCCHASGGHAGFRAALAVADRHDGALRSADMNCLTL